MADRFTYVPLIGIFIAVTWLAADVLARWRDWGKVLAPAAVGVLAACGISARHQVQHWENGETLFRRALAVMPDNAVAHGNLGEYMAWQGRYSEAAAHLREAVRLDPADAGSHCNLVIVLIQDGKIEEATAAAREAAALAEAQGRRDMAEDIAARLKGCESGKPWRQAAPGQ
jgi:tetratricopeptide (TPR) repeat protein